MGLHYVNFANMVTLLSIKIQNSANSIHSDLSRLTNPCFQNRVPINRVNLSQGNIEIVQVSWEFDITKFQLFDSRWLEKYGQILGKLNLVSGEFKLTKFK